MRIACLLISQCIQPGTLCCHLTSHCSYLILQSVTCSQSSLQPGHVLNAQVRQHLPQLGSCIVTHLLIKGEVSGGPLDPASHGLLFSRAVYAADLPCLCQIGHQRVMPVVLARE